MYNHECCDDCRTSNFFWLQGCQDEKNQLMEQFKKENFSQLLALVEAWDKAPHGSPEESGIILQMKDLYHQFLAKKANLAKGFLLEEMAKVSESLEVMKSNKASDVVVAKVSVH